MISLKPSPPNAKPKTTPNIVPFRIGHTGPVDLSERYWDPQADPVRTASDANPAEVAYFRGRRLVGKRIPLPEGYRGAVVKMVDLPASNMIGASTFSSEAKRQNASARSEEMDEEGMDEEDMELCEPKRQMEEIAAFDDVVVWGHEALPAADEPAVRGLQEWIGLAEAMHRHDGVGEISK